MAKKITIYLVDDHQMLIDGLKAIISSEKDFEIVGECTLPLLAFEQIQLLKPDIVLTDINMPELSGIELVRKLKPRMSNTKFIALSMFGERSYIKDMLQAGVSGYILKNTGREELVKAINLVMQGHQFFSEEVEQVIESNPVNDEKINTIHLTEREVDIIDCIAKEMTNAQIAETLFISERTVETHRKNIFRKTGIKGVIGLVKFALDKGFIK
ncbi:MAG: response regulator transcription factor [Bacteroidetes bacterium]|nr:response regulator transcription factor [Bacteroidota bacterium]